MCDGGHTCVMEDTRVGWRTHVCDGGHTCVMEDTRV